MVIIVCCSFIVQMRMAGYSAEKSYSEIKQDPGGGVEKIHKRKGH